MAAIPQVQTVTPSSHDEPPQLSGVLFVIGCEGDTVRYRCYHPQEQLAGRGVRAATRSWNDPHLFGDALDYDLFILHRVMYTGFISDLIDLLHQLGKVAIFDTDDLVFELTTANYDNLLATMDDDHAKRYRQSIRLRAKTLSYCDYALTTTQFLADRLRRHGKQTFITRNSLNDELVQISEDAYRRRAPQENRVVIGYFSGSPSHNQDFAVAAPAVLRLMERYPQVHLHVWGYLSLDDRFARFGERVQQTPYVPWQKLPYEIGQVDVNIAPLELDNPFCQSKSELKYFEAGIVGVPTIASPTDAFKFAITHGENGLLASTTKEWLSNLEQLSLDSARRQALGETARQHVLAHYTPAARGIELTRTLNQIWRDWRARFPAPDVSHPASLIIAQLMRQLTGVGATDDPARTEQLITRLADEKDSRRRPWRRLWAWSKDRLKKQWHRTYEREFFDQTCVLSTELTAGKKQGGRFTATQPDLYRLDIPFATYSRLNTADVILHIQASPDSQDLATVCVSAALLRDNQPYRFTFEPILDSQGREFYFYLESPDAFPGNAVGLWMTQDRQQPAFAPYYLPREREP